MGIDRLNDIDFSATGGITTEEVLALLHGEDLNIHRAERIEREEIAKKAAAHVLTAPSEWPSLAFNWDFRAVAQRFALDGCKPEYFAKCFPQGLQLGWVSLHEFDERLILQNRRELTELWTIGDPKKLAFAIEYIRRSKPITPPLAAPLSGKNQVLLEGGNHRYTIAKFKGLIEIPIYVDPENAGEMSRIVPIRWS